MRSLFGAGLLGCGVLMAGVFGLLTVLAIVGFVAEPIGIPTASAVFALLAVPCAIGLGVFWLGRRQIRRADQEARERVQSGIFD